MNEQFNSSLDPEQLEKRLWDYIDGLSLPEERTGIERLLQENQQWQAKYRELLEVNELLHASELEHPSLRFTKNVMEDIAKLQIAPATKTYINNRIVWGIGAFFIIMIIGFLTYGVSQVSWTSGKGKDIPIDFNKIDIGKFFSNTYVNAFLMINIVIGLFLLDRILAARKKNYQKN